MYRMVNEIYSPESYLVKSWTEFVRGCRQAFGDEFRTPRHRVLGNGTIQTEEAGFWYDTLVPVDVKTSE